MSGTVFKEIISAVYKGGGAYECSCCGAKISKEHCEAVIKAWKYCPYCGAPKIAIERELFR